MNIAGKYFLVQNLHNYIQWNLKITNSTIHFMAEVFLLILNLGKNYVRLSNYEPNFP